MRRRVALALVLFGVSAGVIALAQAPPLQQQTARPVIVDYLPQVDDLDKSELFYHQLLGLESNSGDPRARLGYYPGNPFLNDMYGVAGNIKNFYLLVPVSGLMIEPIQWSEAKGKALSPNFQDPGSTSMVLTVNNIDALADRLQKAGVKILTAGGKPVNVTQAGGTSRVLVVQDFNGFFVELVQPPPGGAGRGNAPPTYYINNASFVLTVDNVETAAKFYQDVMGLTVTVDPAFHAEPDRLAALGMRGAEYRQASVAWPDKTPQMQLVQFRGLPTKPIAPLVADPNSTVFRIFVSNIDTMTAKVKAFPGAKIMNLGGQAYANGNGPNRWLMITAPGNQHLQLVGPTGS